MSTEHVPQQKIIEQYKSQKIEMFEDILKGKIQQSMLLDELIDPGTLKRIGRDGRQIDEPLPDDKINVQMYWQNQTKLIGALIAVPSFIFLILLLGLNNNIFDGIVNGIAFVFTVILGFIPVI